MHVPRKAGLALAVLLALAACGGPAPVEEAQPEASEGFEAGEGGEAEGEEPRDEPAPESPFPRPCAGFLRTPQTRLLAALGGYDWSHARRVNAIDLSSDGTVVASASDDLSVKVWDGVTGKELDALVGHEAPVQALALAPEATLVVSGDEGGVLKVWRLDRPADEPWSTVAHRDGVIAVACSPDGTRALSAGGDGLVKLWDLASAGGAARVLGQGGVALAVTFSPNGRAALAGSVDGTLRVWDLASGQVERALTCGDKVGAVAWSDDGRYILAGTADGSVRLFDLEAGGAERRRDGAAWFAGGGAAIIALGISADGSTVLAGAADGRWVAWALDTGAPRAVLPAGRAKTTAGALLPDGTHALLGDVEGRLRRVPIAPPEAPGEAASPDHRGRLYALAHAEGGRLIASGCSDGSIRVWDAVQGQPLRTLAAHQAPVFSLAASADGRLLSGGGDGLIMVWELASGRLLATLEAWSGAVLALAVSPDGKRALSGGHDGTVQLWDLSTASELRSIEAHDAPVVGVAFSPDGGQALSAGFRGEVKVWDLRAGPPPAGAGAKAEAAPCLRTLPGTPACAALAYVASDAILVARIDGALERWEPTSGERRSRRAREGFQAPEVASAAQFRERTTAVAFAPDRRSAVVASPDGVLHWVDLEDGAERDRIDLGTSGDRALSVAFHPEGSEVAVATQRGSVLRFALGAAARAAEAEDRARAEAALAARAAEAAQRRAAAAGPAEAGLSVTLDGHLDEWRDTAPSAFDAAGRTAEVAGPASDLRAVWVTPGPEGLWVGVKLAGAPQLRGTSGGYSFYLALDRQRWGLEFQVFGNGAALSVTRKLVLEGGRWVTKVASGVQVAAAEGIELFVPWSEVGQTLTAPIAFGVASLEGGRVKDRLQGRFRGALPAAAPIVLDGDDGDWSRLPRAPVTQHAPRGGPAQSVPGADILRVRVAHDARALYVCLDVAGLPDLTGRVHYYVWLAPPGKAYHTIGAGLWGDANSLAWGTMYRYRSAGDRAPQAFEPLGLYGAAHRVVEARIPLEALGEPLRLPLSVQVGAFDPRAQVVLDSVRLQYLGAALR